MCDLIEGRSRSNCFRSANLKSPQKFGWRLHESRFARVISKQKRHERDVPHHGNTVHAISSPRGIGENEGSIVKTVIWPGKENITLKYRTFAGPAILFARLFLFGVRFIFLLLAMVEQLLRGFSDVAVRCLGGAFQYIASASIL